MITINKVTKQASTILFPVPAVLVTCQSGDSAPNIITIAWTGIMNSSPPMVYIGVQPSRHSYSLIKESGEYVINIPSSDWIRVVDYCGTVSGRTVDKFKEKHLNPIPAAHVKPPLINECPVNMECRVRQVISLGSHDVFIAEVLAVHFDENVLDEKGRPDLDRIRPVGYGAGEYRLMADILGQHGCSRTE
ncbi:flavin reductase family protein [Phosphitispora fastidiosa]|uniref:flavin reductase family protein n=1 Tax=Phosphitispora fastidiosa TaxID=2837202 RepID=UPI001E3A8676|nr:flavin reductase family protein [Phosphitispora fastidiosa]MBU7007427.1 flavin reductase (DIM6/NTAB) family NADH-FMN oxidoreductase RutF [Phosphitispora fastidiosa]